VVQLLDSDIRTQKVKTWKGLHVFHALASSCSQKSRVYLNLKGIEWQSHIIDLTKEENLGEFCPGINPRGLVPALDDGHRDLHLDLRTTTLSFFLVDTKV
jgi:glutathione S-transferase